ncbi:hypothetical protein L6164_029365 [Bauhinia variegata]|uniref:Uncharacterized protein n=1 Tax=Bauhinia variegata TaxID=167791 RepID=A0ACB9L9A3_BAUVA|nr:hypothetical protein L6164_029365 [Bauhinia variegata]
MGVHQAIPILVLLLPFLSLLVNGGDHKLKLASCDIYNGRWVYDNSYPLYHSSQCHFIEMPFDCQRNGRPDDVYLRYRWKPFACDLPRFSAVDFLERFRNKKIVFIGDSDYNVSVILERNALLVNIARKSYGWDFIMDGDNLRKDMNRLVAYEKALLTWALWVENNIDTAKTRVFFQGISPTHPK